MPYGRRLRAICRRTGITLPIGLRCAECRHWITDPRGLRTYLRGLIVLPLLLGPSLARPLVAAAVPSFNGLLFALNQSYVFWLTWLLVVGVGGILIQPCFLRFSRSADGGFCEQCGYDLRGSPRLVCPECGHRRTAVVRATAALDDVDPAPAVTPDSDSASPEP